MPKPDTKIVYPSGIREVNEFLSTDDLVRRLKDCAQAFQNLNQDDNNSEYVALALHLASDHFLEHASKDVRLLIACCIADVFRVFAPEAPYKDPEQLKTIFEFFINQLRGLEDPKDPAFKRYFYLLENLAWVKSFNICIELESSNSIFCQLYTLMFNIINDNHSHKVCNFMLDMMCPLISEADVVSQELLDIILAHIIEPRKSQNKNAYNLAKSILKRTSDTVEPYIQSFFNNAIILGKTSESDLTPRLYDLIYELNSIVPSILLSVLPQLDFKLKSNEAKERLEVTRLLARMFSDKDSELAHQNKPLWNCFLGRFNDISVAVRTRCVQYSMHFLINHPALKNDITEQLKKRQHDPDENVRYEVVMAIISAAKKDFSSINDDLLRFVKERTLDKKFKIRKEALLGLATLYKQHFSSSNLSAGTVECLSWIRNKVLHVYYQTALDDRLLVERILHTCLVPYNLPPDQRMQKLFQLYSCIDEHAVKAFNELLKCQNIVRNQVRAMIEALKDSDTVEKKQVLHTKIVALSKSLPEQVKCQEYLKKFCGLMNQNPIARSHMETIVRGDVSCREAESSVKEVLKSCGMPVMTNSFYTTIKQLLERVAPMVIDKNGVMIVIENIEKSINLKPGENHKVVTELLAEKVSTTQQAERGMRLLLTLTSVFPLVFQCEEIFGSLIRFLDVSEETVSGLALQIITNIGENLENVYPNIGARLMPILHNFILQGNVKQAKFAVKCLNAVANDRYAAFSLALEHLKNYLTLESKYFRTALVSIGQIAYLCPDNFGSVIKTIVYKIVVKDLLMVDQTDPEDDGKLWKDEHEIPEETRVKMEGMVMLVKWLKGLKTHVNSASSALRLLSTCIRNKGDLMEKNRISTSEKSYLRLTAAICMLKLVQESAYAEIVTHEQFQGLAVIMKDECKEVRERFMAKLHKGLLGLKLPLEYMGMFAISAHENVRELKTQARHYLYSNISKRRDYLKQHQISNSTLFSLLPDYVLPYAIHLLAHEPEFNVYDHVPSLQKIRENLWFIMEPLMLKNENYSFSFFKRLIENIKQTEDGQNPKDEMTNKKLYAVCDLALSLVMSKTTNFILREYPVEPLLPNKLYVNADPNHGNTRNYLPPMDFQYSVPKKSRMESDMLITTNNKPKAAIMQPKTNGNDLRSDSLGDSQMSDVSSQQLGAGDESKENASPEDNKASSISQDSIGVQVRKPRGRPPRQRVRDDVLDVSHHIASPDPSDDKNTSSCDLQASINDDRQLDDEAKIDESSSLPSSSISTESGVVDNKRVRRKPKYLDDETYDQSSSSEMNAGKRRRGRPAKSPEKDSSSQESTPKRRGRPKSKLDYEPAIDTSDSRNNDSVSSESGPKRRGRPAKAKLDIDNSDSESGDQDDEDLSSFDKPQESDSFADSLKNDGSEEKLTEDSESSSKRKRGRPSKRVKSEDESDSISSSSTSKTSGSKSGLEEPKVKRPALRRRP